MRIDERLASGAPCFSFEFFPPRTEEGERNLEHALEELSGMDPAFVSVTYGAGGTSAQKQKTIDIVTQAKVRFGLEAMAHFTCVGATVEELRGTLDRMRDAGIENVLALRGDPPAGEEEWTATPGGLSYSRELIELIRTDYDFSIGAACFPEVHIHAESAESDLRYCRAKVDAGARFLITQLFFDNAAYWDFVARARDDHADRQRRADPALHRNVRGDHPRPAAARTRAARGPAGCRGGLRRGVRDAAVRRAAGGRRPGDPLLHAEPLPRDAGDPRRAALYGAVARRRVGLTHAA
jgi:hypothetical protein